MGLGWDGHKGGGLHQHDTPVQLRREHSAWCRDAIQWDEDDACLERTDGRTSLLVLAHFMLSFNGIVALVSPPKRAPVAPYFETDLLTAQHYSTSYLASLSAEATGGSTAHQALCAVLKSSHRLLPVRGKSASFQARGAILAVCQRRAWHGWHSYALLV